MLAAIVRRISKIENQIDKAAKEIRAKDCNCFGHVDFIPGRLAEFEAEMNKTCPVHGFRRLSYPILIFDEPDEQDKPRFDELLDRYHKGCEEYERREQRRKDIIKSGVLKIAGKKRQLVL